MEEPNNIERQDRIEAYVRGTMGESERRSFEQDLAREHDLMAAVAVERVMHETLGRKEELAFRDVVRQVSNQQDRDEQGGGVGEKPVIPMDRGRWQWWAVAAGVALLVGVGSVLMLKGPGSEQLALAQVGTYSLQVRSDSSAFDQNSKRLMQARQFILDRKAADAITTLQQPLEGVCPDAERMWLLGVAYLLTGDETKARSELERAGKAGCSISRNATELLDEL